MAAGKTWLEKAQNACPACPTCNGVFPLDPDEAPEQEEIDEHVQFIRGKYLADKAGCRFDWTSADYVTGSLFLAFSNAELEIVRIQNLRMQSFLRGWMKEQ